MHVTYQIALNQQPHESKTTTPLAAVAVFVLRAK